MENMKPSTAYVYLSLARLGWSAVVSQDHWLTATADSATLPLLLGLSDFEMALVIFYSDCHERFFLFLYSH
jgi:hypothetical protein